SFNRTVIDEEPVSTLTDVGEAVIVEVAPDAAPGVKVTDACAWIALPLLTAAPPNVATKTPDPVEVGAVTVAVYVPFALSVTALIKPVPADLVIVTVDPPVVRLFPFASFACTVNTCVAIPLAVIEA